MNLIKETIQSPKFGVKFNPHIGPRLKSSTQDTTACKLCSSSLQLAMLTLQSSSRARDTEDNGLDAKEHILITLNTFPHWDWSCCWNWVVLKGSCVQLHTHSQDSQNIGPQKHCSDSITVGPRNCTTDFNRKRKNQTLNEYVVLRYSDGSNLRGWNQWETVSARSASSCEVMRAHALLN